MDNLGYLMALKDSLGGGDEDVVQDAIDRIRELEAEVEAVQIAFNDMQDAVEAVVARGELSGPDEYGDPPRVPIWELRAALTPPEET